MIDIYILSFKSKFRTQSGLIQSSEMLTALPKLVSLDQSEIFYFKIQSFVLNREYPNGRTQANEAVIKVSLFTVKLRKIRAMQKEFHKTKLI